MNIRSLLVMCLALLSLVAPVLSKGNPAQPVTPPIYFAESVGSASDPVPEHIRIKMRQQTESTPQSSQKKEEGNFKINPMYIVAFIPVIILALIVKSFFPNYRWREISNAYTVTVDGATIAFNIECKVLHCDKCNTAKMWEKIRAETLACMEKLLTTPLKRVTPEDTTLSVLAKRMKGIVITHGKDSNHEIRLRQVYITWCEQSAVQTLNAILTSRRQAATEAEKQRQQREKEAAERAQRAAEEAQRRREAAEASGETEEPSGIDYDEWDSYYDDYPDDGNYYDQPGEE